MHRANLISILADFNECEGEGSGENCQQVCVNNPGSFSCACFDGFASINSTHCESKTYVEIFQCVNHCLGKFLVHLFQIKIGCWDICIIRLTAAMKTIIASIIIGCQLKRHCQIHPIPKVRDQEDGGGGGSTRGA